MANDSYFESSTIETGASVVPGWQLLIAAGIAALVLWGVAFSPSPLAHNAAHDVRHVAGTPCH